MNVVSHVVFHTFSYIFQGLQKLQSKIQNQRICVSFTCIFAFYPTINPHEPHLFKYELSKRQQQTHTHMRYDKEVMKIVLSLYLTLCFETFLCAHTSEYIFGHSSLTLSYIYIRIIQ